LPAAAIVAIPARLASTRLPDKPLADIHGEPMIVHVWRRACEAAIGRIVVAAADKAIADAIHAVGGEAVLTDPALPSGSDRVHQAVRAVDPDGAHDIVLNLQGDLPTLDPAAIRRVVEALRDSEADLATLVAQITEAREVQDPNVVKAVVSFPPGARTGRALYFTRNPAPWGDGPHYHHIGIYAYRRAALDRFVRLPPSPLEGRERLEQLRALESGMRIDAVLVDTVPLGVDTQADLERARALLAGVGVR
jgi:3-deoxy-manno-octulosonate cytidylyltransferase (CMP-KDO synthetase)